MKITNKQVIEQLNGFLNRGYKKIGFYGRNSAFIYLKRGDEVAVPFCLEDSTFNIFEEGVI